MIARGQTTSTPWIATTKRAHSRPNPTYVGIVRMLFASSKMFWLQKKKNAHVFVFSFAMPTQGTVLSVDTKPSTCAHCDRVHSTDAVPVTMHAIWSLLAQFACLSPCHDKRLLDGYNFYTPFPHLTFYCVSLVFWLHRLHASYTVHLLALPSYNYSYIDYRHGLDSSCDFFCRAEIVSS